MAIQIEYRKTGDTTWIVATADATLPHIISSLDPEEYEVRKLDTATGLYSDIATEVADGNDSLDVPDAPFLSSATNQTINGADLSWSSVAGSDQYRLDISTDSGFASFISGYLSKIVATNSITISDLPDNTIYYVRVRSENENGLSTYSNSVSFSTLDEFIQEADDLFVLMAERGEEPDDNLKNEIETAISDLKTAGVFQKLDYLIPFGYPSANAGLVNWIKNAHHGELKTNNAGALPTFTQYVGFTGNDQGYIEIDYTPSIDAVNVAVNNASFGGWQNNNIAESGPLFGSQSDSKGVVILPRLTTDQITTKLFNVTAQSYTNTIANALFTVRTSNGTSWQTIRSQSILGSSNDPAVELPSNKVCFLAQNLNGSIVGFGTKTIKFGYGGAYLTDVELGNLITIMTAFFAATITLSCQSKTQIDEYGIGGQSNAEGRIISSALVAPYDEPIEGVEIFYKPDGTSTDNGSWQTLDPCVNTSYSGNGWAGVEIFLGKLLADYRPNKIGFIKCALGSSYLSQYTPTDREDWSPLSTGEMHQREEDWFYAPAIAAKSGVQINKKCYIWAQGEADANEYAVTNGFTAAYQALLEDRIAHVRTLYGKPDLPFIIIKIHQDLATRETEPGVLTYPGFQTIENAQIWAAENIPNVYLIDCDTCELLPDGIHYSFNGFQTMAGFIFDVIKDF